MAHSSGLARFLLGVSLLMFLSTQSVDLDVYIPPKDDVDFVHSVQQTVGGNKHLAKHVTTPSFPIDHLDDLISNFSSYRHAGMDVSRWINKTIRQWGCNRNETPLIFVHIGKAGGGMIRARFAAAALEYDRENWYAPHKDHHFYPVHRNANASFCNSAYKRFAVPNTQVTVKSFEGYLPCNATTPIGMALACPEPLEERRRCRGCQDMKSKDCHLVYVGHNNLGSELHWLPPKYLRKWWRSTPWKNNIDVNWKPIYSNGHVWCTTPNLKRPWHLRPTSTQRYQQLFDDCSIPIGAHWDSMFQTFWKNVDSVGTDEEGPLNYSPIYASLPVQRATIVREPWSWLVSKFFWHHDLDSEFRCDDLSTATDWAREYSLQGISYLCGDDCRIRWDRNQISLLELWIQSESNLRHAFSVVGLMNETLTFYEMISARVAYLDMSRNPDVEGERHVSGRTRETVRCHKVFQDPAFQKVMRERVPLVGLLDHLYHVAVEVNRFQLQELRQCQGRMGILWSKNHFH